jgi:hypothetical protein
MPSPRDSQLRRGQAGNPHDKPVPDAARALSVLWWIVCPAFLVVVLLFIRERACFDRHYLLPGISVKPLLAWLVSSIYLTAHAWLIAAYAVTVMRTGALLPRVSAARAAWSGAWPQVMAMVGLFLLENAPAEIWIRLARLIGC